MAPIPAPTANSDATDRDGMTGVHVAILVLCIFAFGIFLCSFILHCYRRDKRRAEYSQQLSRAPTPTPVRALNAPPPAPPAPGPSSGNIMSEVPRPQHSSAGRTSGEARAGGTAGAARRPQNPSPDAAGGGPGRAATWTSNRYNQTSYAQQPAAGARPQKSVPRLDAVPARSALSSRNGVPNGVVRPSTGDAVGSSGQEYWHAR